MTIRRPALIASGALALLAAGVVAVVVLPPATVSAAHLSALEAFWTLQTNRFGFLQVHEGFAQAVALALVVAVLPLAFVALLGRRHRVVALVIATTLAAAGVVAAAVHTHLAGADGSAAAVSLTIIAVAGLVLGSVVTAAWCALTSDGGNRLSVRATGGSRLVAIVVTACYGVVVALVALHRTPVDAGAASTLFRMFRWLDAHGFPSWFDYDALQWSANVAFFLPLGALVVLLFGGRSWWIVSIAGFVLSSSIELVQLFFLPSRFATVDDVVANTLGAVLGSLVGVVALGLMAGRRRREHEQVLALPA